MVYSEIPFKDIPLDELPNPDEKLENPDLREYIEQLQQEEIICKPEKIQDFKIVWKDQGSIIIFEALMVITKCTVIIHENLLTVRPLNHGVHA